MWSRSNSNHNVQESRETTLVAFTFAIVDKQMSQKRFGLDSGPMRLTLAESKGNNGATNPRETSVDGKWHSN
ncbi:uncharacterized protein PHALS_07312 [Plasmopara halstedii]|uniref:Uncharacterized protein n=1 Tax=Plasmopara halstedii TaxID=4781 RepID=A0A0P1B557_PLAHL|nr:uncharacterized protein PHALS_07312 [Plasmopara halstedii]CEG49554.1 hypothetical protein PHALS_07312 [Plasmopara halstedii]|eukprot:XP_024585923.1 hypothetical protein PHALS_07312 [Plasmopara halstedii]